MPKMVCVKCEVEFQVGKNGVKVLEMMNQNTAPYKLWDADKWKCPVCGVEVIAGFGGMPLVEHYEPDFVSYVDMCRDRGDEIVLDKEVRSAEHLQG